MQFFKFQAKTLIVGLIIFLIFLLFGLLIVAIKPRQLGKEVAASPATPTQAQELAELIKEPERTDLLLPDMSIKTPTQLYIAGTGANKKLRFSTTFVNLGPGPLEVLGHPDLKNNQTHAAQYIYAEGAPGEYRNIGSFELHPTHKHWHVKDHVRYQLWSMNDQGNRQELLAETGKLSYCLWDEGANDLTIANAPQARVYGFTCSRNTQGMSVGWSDTYAARVDGQHLDIPEVEDGEYILRFEVNPDRKIFEVGYDNNAGELKIKIQGQRVTVVAD